MRARKARHGCSYSSFRLFFFLPLLCCDYCSCCNKNSARESVFFFPPFFNSVCVCVSAIHRLHFDKLYFVFFFTKHPQRRIKGFRSRRLDPALLKWKKKKKEKELRSRKAVSSGVICFVIGAVCVCA